MNMKMQLIKNLYDRAKAVIIGVLVAFSKYIINK